MTNGFNLASVGALILLSLTLVSFKEIAELQRVYKKSRMPQDSIHMKELPTGLQKYSNFKVFPLFLSTLLPKIFTIILN